MSMVEAMWRGLDEDAEGASYAKFLSALASEETLPAATPDHEDAEGDALDIIALMEADGVSVTAPEERRGEDESDADDLDIDALMEADGVSVTAPEKRRGEDDGDAGDEDLDAIDIDALMEADGVSVTAPEDRQGEDESDAGDEGDGFLDVDSPTYLEVLMLKDILEKAQLDIDIMMLKDLLESKEFAALLRGEAATTVIGGVDITPLLDVFSIGEWSALIQRWMSPAAARAARPAVAMDDLWATILAGPDRAPAPPPSWFNTVCAWFARPALPDDAIAPGTAHGAVPVTVTRGDAVAAPGKEEKPEEDTASMAASETSTLPSMV